MSDTPVATITVKKRDMELLNDKTLLAGRQVEQLTHENLKTALRWATELCLVQNPSRLVSICRALHDELPITAMAFFHGRLNARREVERIQQIHNISYPENWIALYRRETFLRSDPVLQNDPTDRLAKIWPTLFTEAQQPEQIRFVELAADFGLTHGVTYSHYSPRDGEVCLLSIAGAPTLLDENNLVLLDVLAPHLHQAAVRVKEPAADDSPGGLSTREQDIMRWMKLGKTNWEIAMILGISERTAKFHVSNIMRKLQVSRRAEAVYAASKRGLI